MHMPEYAQFQNQMNFSGNSGAKASPPNWAKQRNFDAQKRSTIAQIACARTFSRHGRTNSSIVVNAKA